jgi:hypothetical protein
VPAGLFNSVRAVFPGSLFAIAASKFSVEIAAYKLEIYVMRRRFIFPIVAAVLTLVALTPGLGLAQPLPEPPVGLKPLPPPPAAPIKPYTAVPITPPTLFDDASFIAFRQNLGDVAEHKDRAALGKLVVATGFFWIQDKDLADPSQSGIDNLAKALDLDSKNEVGWDTLAEAAAEPTAAEPPQHKGIFCAPAPPGFDPQAFVKLLQATETDATEWVYPIDNGVEVRGAGKPDAQVVDKIGLYFVRVLPDSTPPDPGAPPFLHVALPNGKTGFVSATVIAALAADQICYTKDADGWKIAGFVGGS